MHPKVSPLAAAGQDRRARSFADQLKNWRRNRRMSQLDLALSSGVSQRHISFLESGRAKPSRSMLLLLSETLQVPLRDRNHWLVSAGFAPVYGARRIDDPQMSQLLTAVQMMLANHEPFPAIAIDRAWNIRLANAAFERLSAVIGSTNTSPNTGEPERNLMRLFFHPGGIRSFVTNWTAIAPALWCRAQREADAVGGEDMREILRELAPHQDSRLLWVSDDVPLLPVLPVTIEKDGVRISLFTMISTFGTAQDITADELRIESFFPADEMTGQIFRSMQKT